MENPALPNVFDAKVRHAIFTNRFAGGLHSDFLPILEQIKKDVLSKIKGSTIRNESVASRLIKDLDKLIAIGYGEYQKDLLSKLKDFAKHELDFEHTLISKFIDSDLNLPTPTQIWAAITSNPITLDASETSILLEPFIKNMGAAERKRVEQLIRFGFIENMSSNQIAARISKAGLGTKSAMNNRLLVRTATNHIATTAQITFDEANKDVITGYKIIAVLDSRTTNFCKGIDGKVVKWADKSKPRPPFHIGCRTTTKPTLNKRHATETVDTDKNYYQWLKSEGNKKGGREFVKDILGQKRGKLFLDGGLSADEFKRLTTDQLFNPITLDELMKKDALSEAFNKANITGG